MEIITALPIQYSDSTNSGKYF